MRASLAAAISRSSICRRRWRNIERLIFEELQRIARELSQRRRGSAGQGAIAQSSMSGLVGASAGTNQTLVQLRELERESETYRNLYQTFMQRYQETLQQQSFPITEARVITAATPPSRPELSEAWD